MSYVYPTLVPTLLAWQHPFRSEALQRDLVLLSVTFIFVSSPVFSSVIHSIGKSVKGEVAVLSPNSIAQMF